MTDPTPKADDVVSGSSETTELTERQHAVLAFVHEHLELHNYPPSVREIGDAVGLASPSSVHAHLNTLEEKGFLKRDPTKPRALEVARDPDTMLELKPSVARNVPLVGEIAAGAPIIAEERVDSVYPLPKDLVGDGTLFMLKVRGESMIEAGVFDGDFVVIREQPEVAQGDMCAALVDGEATVKFFRRTKAGEVFLDPANAAYDPIPVTAGQDARIMGKVTAVLRSVR